jgi:hypothetical protein
VHSQLLPDSVSVDKQQLVLLDDLQVTQPVPGISTSKTTSTKSSSGFKTSILSTFNAAAAVFHASQVSADTYSGRSYTDSIVRVNTPPGEVNNRDSGGLQSALRGAGARIKAAGVQVSQKNSAVPTIAAPQEVYSALTSRGHHAVVPYTEGLGVCQLVYVDPDSGVLHAVSDPRKNGHPAGVK